jgi:sugar lactone lactonase YvrE
MNAVERVPVPECELGEGPCWVDGSLLWVDIPAGRVHRYDPADGSHGTAEVGQAVGAVVPRAGGGLVLAVRDGFARFDLDRGGLELIAAVEADKPGNRMNDGKCDRAGRFFAGTKADDDRPGAGALYRLENGAVEQLIGGVTISNGIGWSPDERLMYYVDTPTGRIDVFDFDAVTGALANRRVFADIPGDCGQPDGLCVDAGGAVWAALWGGGAVHRYRADGGLDRVLRLPVSNVTCCAFGGADLDVLYITTARTDEPNAGALFRCWPGVTGQPANPYRDGSTG